MEPIIRRARAEDAPEVCALVRQAIEQSCEADHQGRPEVLRAWLNDKTPEQVERWLTVPDALAVVAQQADGVLGVGVLGRAGHLSLCFVAPRCQHRGIGRAVLSALIEEARTRALPVLTLGSTATALPFYRSLGFEPCGAPSRIHGVEVTPMRMGLGSDRRKQDEQEPR